MLFIDLTPVIPMDTQNNFLTFEIFAFDTSNQSHIKTPDNLVYLLASNNSFWNGTPQIDCNSRQIKDNFIEITVNPIKFDQDSKDKCITGFSIVVKGEYGCLEPQRIPILKFFKDQKLEKLDIVKDEISEQIANQIYPCINRVERRLRDYITKFMTTKIGVDWWTKVSSVGSSYVSTGGVSKSKKRKTAADVLERHLQMKQQAKDDVLKSEKAASYQLKSYCLGMNQLMELSEKSTATLNSEQKKLMARMKSTLGVAVNTMESHIKCGTIWCPTNAEEQKEKTPKRSNSSGKRKSRATKKLGSEDTAARKLLSSGEETKEK